MLKNIMLGAEASKNFDGSSSTLYENLALASPKLADSRLQFQFPCPGEQ